MIIFFFPSCAAKKDQNVQNDSIKPLQETKTDATIAEKQTIERRIIETIKVLKKSTSIEVIIEGNKELKYTSIKQSFPFGIAIYLPDTILDEKITSIASETGSISNIIPSYADKDKKTAKIEILLNEDLPYDIKRESGNLMVIISSENKIAKSDNNQANALKKGNKGTDNKALKIPKGMANVAHIEFNVEDEGYTELTLTTSHPIKYDFSKGSKGILYLNLYDTNIPQRHSRPFETKYFKSAVYKILPIQKAKNSKNSKIEISMREKVPYQVVQNNNTIIARFEPSSIEPPKFTKADKTVSNKLVNEIDTKPSQPEIISQTPDNPIIDKPEPVDNPNENLKPLIVTQKSPPQIKVTPPDSASNSFSNEKKYTGEKIKLDFYETDIKNVFRILSSISNKNFAIDKNVTGSVTLTLDNPIPWDQVLDLVLSMNQLDKIEKGNVIRIATQATLATEATQQHAKYKAIQKAKEAQKALEPTVTEYIPINYANADSDIMPHIKQILTSKRGSVSVDKRTNMIIITDTKEVIIKAKELIYTLDNVTPQIMISAKIVEANKDFSRNLGLGAIFGFDENVANHGNDWHEVSLNAPASAPTNYTAFTFHNLVGGAFGDGGTSFLQLTLSAAESKGDIEVVSSPKILTLDNVKAKIKQGIEYPYLKSDGDGNTTVSYKQIDLLLEVTPHVTPDKRISMEILVTKNEIAGWTGLGASQIPYLAINDARTTLLVNNNDTIVIGGVLKSKTTNDKQGFPFLMNIPLLGRLFRTDIETEDKQELLIFITPTIVQLEQRRNKIDPLDGSKL
ncbi:MAG: type IV pilus secretin PilQ [Desulfobacterales bacterium]|nr:type IV pilus secretin PilQ [Desulfobacterales bacterium]